jgi:LuxR family quorum sensing-dependent transcriptional regulator
LAFIADLDRLSSANDVLTATERVLHRFGLDRILFTGLVPRTSQRFDEIVLATGWPQEFLDLYVDRDFIRFDPVARLGRRSMNPFEWDGTSDFGADELRVREVIKRAADFGIVRGFVVPIHGPAGYEACVSMSGAEIELPAHIKPAIHLWAIYAFNRLQSLATPPFERTSSLTIREREVLSWAAKGKSAWEIGEILHIAKRTVDEHAQTAFRKLGAVNRTQAVAIALRDSLITM